MIPKNLLPEQYSHDAFIAGGYAACPGLAQDIDVWVPWIAACNQLSVKREILAHLIGEGFDVEIERGVATEADLYVHELDITKVAIVHQAKNLPIHIMSINRDVDELLSGFDISTHQIALTSTGVVKGAHWTPPTVRPVAFQGNANTPKRLEKLLLRYGYPVEQEETFGV